MDNDIKSLAGTYDLTHDSPDRLTQKQLRIFPDGRFYLLEFEGSMAGAYQNYYNGVIRLDANHVFFEVYELEGYSNFLVDDAMSDEERTSITPHEEVFEGDIIIIGEDVLIRTKRGGYEFEWKKIRVSF